MTTESTKKASSRARKPRKRGPKPRKLPRNWETLVYEYAMSVTNKADVRFAIRDSAGRPLFGRTRWVELLKEDPRLLEVIEAAWEGRKHPIVGNIVERAQAGDDKAQEQFFKRIDEHARLEAAKAKQQHAPNVSVNVAVVGADVEARRAQIAQWIEQHAPGGSLQQKPAPNAIEHDDYGEPIEGELLQGSSFLRIKHEGDDDAS